MEVVRLYFRGLQQIDNEKPLAVALVFASAIVAMLSFIEPLFFGRIVNTMVAWTTDPSLRETEPYQFPIVVLTWAALCALNIGMSFWIGMEADFLSHRRRIYVLRKHFDHVITLPIAFHTSKHSGRIMKIMYSGAHSVWEIVLCFFRDQVACLIAVFFLLPWVIWLNWRMGSVLVVLVAIFGFLMTFVQQYTKHRQEVVENLNADVSETISDVLGNVAVVQSFTRVHDEARLVHRKGEKALRAQMPVLTWYACLWVATRGASTATTLIVFALGSWLFTQGKITVGEIVTFTSIAGNLIGRLEQVARFVSSLFSHAPRLRQFFDVIDKLPAVADKETAVELGRAEGEVEFVNVSYSHDGQRDAVSGVSFKIKQGETVALVGATGSGKTTIAGLLYRAYDAREGQVFVDGADVRDLTVDSLRRNVGVVFQEAQLFARTIRENLAIGRADATDADMMEALKRAQAAELVVGKRDGLNTLVAERGRTLSGGERQRLSIARALVKDPPILIMDEATSALDATTERKVQEALQEAKRGRTTLIITHRLVTIRHATRVIVMARGRVAEEGTFEELVKRGRSICRAGSGAVSDIVLPAMCLFLATFSAFGGVKFLLGSMELSLSRLM